GLEAADPEVLSFVSALLPEGEYLPMLLEVRPRLITPMREGDYFAEDQVRTWGLNANSGLPEDPRAAYYRTGTRDISPSARLFEFVVPMVPPTWNDPARVDEQIELLSASSAPTALAVSILDVCQPAVSDAPEASLAHWGFAHFLLDGHHKMEAASQVDRPLRLLTLTSIENGLAKREDVLRLPNVLVER
ncbi:MAG TPA: hypothetical protein VMK12_24095, partial [Anaeromyxobacteraceae bacterium]|nr:hypothetical protein [Anaeromyxobacteraceae bacterium]